MTYISTKSKFHIALDGVGLILQGAPNAPGYKMTNAPVYGTRFASGDRDYNDLTQWWYLVQTDWSGGFKESVSFVDDAKFYYSSNIDARTKPGTIRLDRQITQVFDNTANSDPVFDVRNYTWGGNLLTGVLADEIRDLAGVDKADADLGSIQFMNSFKTNLWAVDRTGGKVWYTADTSYPLTFVDVTANVNSVITGSSAAANALVNVGETTQYVFGTSSTGAQNIYIVSTTSATGATFTLVKEFAHKTITGFVVGAELYGADIIFLTTGLVWTLHSLDLTTNVVTTLYEFDTGDEISSYATGNRYITPFQGKLLITFLSNESSGEGKIYTYDGTSVEEIFRTDEAKGDFSTPEARTFLRGGAVVYNGYAMWGNLVYDGEHFYNFIKTLDDDPAYNLVPIGNDGIVLYLADTETVSGDQQVILYSYDYNGTTYKNGENNEAFLVFNQHDKLQSIDKLLNSVTLGFEQFVSGQSIKVYYSTNPIPDPNITTGDWTLLGTASHTLDGASVTSKTFLFPVGTTAKKVWLRIDLASDGTNTPGVLDLTLEYLPMPDYKKQWTLNINAGDEVKRLDGALVETTGRELKSRLERMWWTKSALDFQDLDYATTLVNDASFDASETTITVDSTYDFPEQGRLRVDDEEILYTGKTPTTFTGCTRGARGTLASTHDDDSVINNAYRVIIIDVNETTPILLEDKELEYQVGIMLREV